MWPRGATETALWGWWLQLSSSLNFPSCRLDNPSHADGTFSNRDVVSPESEALFLIFSCILIKGKPGRVEMKERVLRAWEWHTKRGHANHARVGSVECQSGTTWFQSLCRFVWTGILFGVSLLSSILNDLHNSWKGVRPVFVSFYLFCWWIFYNDLQFLWFWTSKITHEISGEKLIGERESLPDNACWAWWFPVPSWRLSSSSLERS